MRGICTQPLQHSDITQMAVVFLYSSMNSLGHKSIRFYHSIKFSSKIRCGIDFGQAQSRYLLLLLGAIEALLQ